MSRDETKSLPPPGLTRRLAELQRDINIEMSALTSQQRAERAKEDLRYMPGQAYLFRDGDNG